MSNPYRDPYCESIDNVTCCECGGDVFITPNECWPWRCSNHDCAHDKCKDCEEVDESGMTVLGSEFSDDEFILQDHEAEQVIREGNFRSRAPRSLKCLQPLLSPALSIDYQRTPPEIQSRIMVYALLPKPRVIKVRWSHLQRQWHYESVPIPAIITAVGLGNVTSIALEFLQRAPALPGSSRPLPWVNYQDDIISFEYFRCGSRKKDMDEYICAIMAAASIVGTHANTAGRRKVSQVHISWCQAAEKFDVVLGKFKSIRGLKEVTLVAHDHYDRQLKSLSSERKLWPDQLGFDVEGQEKYGFWELGLGSIDV
ncbi:hypothetical protein LZ554_004614 [Drepanopeziza brunnea f. sp. 'monogermtubi']|nr:hypothetical protein LZ554_004614 [Drepanopeziza brunnea f. sp. 'monogermtubi']